MSRIEEALAKTRSDLLVYTMMDVALLTAFLLSMGSAPSRHATFSIEAATPRAAEVVSTVVDGTSPHSKVAEADSLDLQLD